MKFTPTFKVTKNQNKDYYIVVNYADGCYCYFEYVFNSISNTYSGFRCISFIDSIRGLLKQYPTFFNDISEHNYDKKLIKMGFIEIKNN